MIIGRGSEFDRWWWCLSWSRREERFAFNGEWLLQTERGMSKGCGRRQSERGNKVGANKAVNDKRMKEEERATREVRDGRLQMAVEQICMIEERPQLEQMLCSSERMRRRVEMQSLWLVRHKHEWRKLVQRKLERHMLEQHRLVQRRP